MIHHRRRYPQVSYRDTKSGGTSARSLELALHYAVRNERDPRPACTGPKHLSKFSCRSCLEGRAGTPAAVIAPIYASRHTNPAVLAGCVARRLIDRKGAESRLRIRSLLAVLTYGYIDIGTAASYIGIWE